MRKHHRISKDPAYLPGVTVNEVIDWNGICVCVWSGGGGGGEKSSDKIFRPGWHLC